MLKSRADLKIQDLQDLRAIFSTREGARFLARLINDMCGVYQISYSGEEMSAMVFKEGARNVGLEIFFDLQLLDENAVAKIGEANKERMIDVQAQEDL